MSRETRTQIIAGLLLLVFLATSGNLAVMLSASAGRNKLGYAERAEDSDPPQVALGIAMGAFRGVFVNLLWIRANALKEAGRYHEAIDLSSTITKLQPRFPQVWAFHAWNMAYNISVTTKTAHERWQWVRAGINLLRDEGIPANPNNMLLHKELGWIYLHKIQGYTDDANGYYKRQVAGEWTIVLGPPPRPDPIALDRDAAIGRFVEWLAPIAEAPATLEEVVRAHPAVATLVERLDREAGLKPDLELLRWYESHRALSRSVQHEAMRRVMGPRRQAFEAMFSDPALAPAWEALLPYVRRRVLVDEYKMEPERMVRYTREFGPIDWRHPAAHGLYWAARGVERALLRRTRLNERDFDLLNTDRVAVQSVQELWRSGELYFDFLAYVHDPSSPQITYITLPNVHFIPAYRKIMYAAAERSWADVRSRPFGTLAQGYENFMKDAIRYLYRRGQVRLAAQYLRDLATWEGQNLNDPDRPWMLTDDLDDFVRRELADRITSPNVAREETVGALFGAYASGLLAGNYEAFERQFRYAAAAHKAYFEQQYRLNPIDPANVRMEQLPSDFRLLAGAVFVEFMNILDLDDAQRVYDMAPDTLRVYAYDLLRQRFGQVVEDLAGQGGQPFDVLFPPPPGLEEHRRRLQAEIQRRQQSAPQAAPK